MHVFPYRNTHQKPWQHVFIRWVFLCILNLGVLWHHILIALAHRYNITPFQCQNSTDFACKLCVWVLRTIRGFALGKSVLIHHCQNASNDGQKESLTLLGGFVMVRKKMELPWSLHGREQQNIKSAMVLCFLTL